MTDPTALPRPFFEGKDELGEHAYFHSPEDAQTYQAARGGYVLMTTPERIWRVTQPMDCYSREGSLQ